MSQVAVLAFIVVPVIVGGQGHQRLVFPRKPLITGATGSELVADAALPISFDWRDINGRSFVVADVNQHIPQYCGSCWIHGTVAALNDRLKIRRNKHWPDVMLARQTLLNCVPGPNNAAPRGCFGGEPALIFAYMQNHSVPDETCNVWKAKQDDTCEPKTICSNCDVPDGFIQAVASGMDPSEAKTKFDFTSGCRAIENFVGYRVGDYGFIEGPTATTEADMMKEIYAHGPLVCSMDGTANFMLGYDAIAESNEGVFVTEHPMNNTDHDVEVVGWGETVSGLKYWVVRNSWGTYWGENGWFKLARGKNQNNIETDCAWAVPYSDDLKLELEGKVLGDYHLGVHLVHTTHSSSDETILATSSHSMDSVPQPLLLAIVSAVSSILTIFLTRFCQAAPRGSEPLLS